MLSSTVSLLNMHACVQRQSLSFMLESISNYLKKCKTSSTASEVAVMLHHLKSQDVDYLTNTITMNYFDSIIVQNLNRIRQQGCSYIFEPHIFSYIQQHVSFHRNHTDNPLLCSMAYCTLETCSLTKYLRIQD